MTNLEKKLYYTFFFCEIYCENACKYESFAFLTYENLSSIYCMFYKKNTRISIN